MSAETHRRASKFAKARDASSPPTTSTWIASVPALVVTTVLAACSAGPGAEVGEESSSTSQAIYGGQADNDANQNSAVVSLKIGDGTQFELCSAALIAPNVVLTARHCVSVNITTGVACDSNGASGNGDQLGADEPIASIHVFTGPTPAFTGTPAANAKAIFHTTSTIICNGDMALIVLDKNITGIAPLKVRMMAPTTAGEMVRSVGYGQNDISLPVGTRLR
jgi:hypothetical protein